MPSTVLKTKKMMQTFLERFNTNPSETIGNLDIAFQMGAQSTYLFNLMKKQTQKMDSIHDFGNSRGSYIASDSSKYKRETEDYTCNGMVYSYLLNVSYPEPGTGWNTGPDKIDKIPGYLFSKFSYPGAGKFSMPIDDIEDYSLLLSIKARGDTSKFKCLKLPPGKDLTLLAKMKKDIAEFFDNYKADSGNDRINCIIDTPGNFTKILGSTPDDNVFASVLTQESAHDSATSKSSHISFEDKSYSDFYVEVPGQERVYKPGLTGLDTFESNFTIKFTGMLFAGENDKLYKTKVKFEKAPSFSREIEYVMNSDSHPGCVPKIVKKINDTIKSSRILKPLEKTDLKNNNVSNFFTHFYDKINSDYSLPASIADEIDFGFTDKRSGDGLQGKLCKYIQGNNIKFYKAKKTGNIYTIDKGTEFTLKKIILITIDRVLFSYCVNHGIACIYMGTKYVLLFNPNGSTAFGGGSILGGGKLNSIKKGKKEKKVPIYQKGGEKNYDYWWDIIYNVPTVLKNQIPLMLNQQILLMYGDDYADAYDAARSSRSRPYNRKLFKAIEHITNYKDHQLDVVYDFYGKKREGEEDKIVRSNCVTLVDDKTLEILQSDTNAAEVDSAIYNNIHENGVPYINLLRIKSPIKSLVKVSKTLDNLNTYNEFLKNNNTIGADEGIVLNEDDAVQDAYNSMLENFELKFYFGTYNSRNNKKIGADREFTINKGYIKELMDNRYKILPRINRNLSQRFTEDLLYTNTDMTFARVENNTTENNESIESDVTGSIEPRSQYFFGGEPTEDTPVPSDGIPKLDDYYNIFLTESEFLKNIMDESKIIENNTKTLEIYFNLFSRYENMLCFDNDEYDASFIKNEDLEYTTKIDMYIIFKFLLDDFCYNKDKICYGLLEYFLDLFKDKYYNAKEDFNSLVRYLFSNYKPHNIYANKTIEGLGYLINEENEIFKATKKYFEVELFEKVSRKMSEITIFLDSDNITDEIKKSYINKYFGVYGFMNTCLNFRLNVEKINAEISSPITVPITLSSQARGIDKSKGMQYNSKDADMIRRGIDIQPILGQGGNKKTKKNRKTKKNKKYASKLTRPKKRYTTRLTRRNRYKK